MERPPSAAAPHALRSFPPAADGNEDADSPPLFQRVRSLRPLYQALSVAVLSSALCALVFSPLPLWRPVGVLMLRKLWDILRFLAVTASIGLGILNSKLWRDSREGKLARRRDDISLGNGGGDSFSSKLPFAGMFYSELQPSYSFFEKFHSPESDVPGRTESEYKEAMDATTAAAVVASAATDHSENEPHLETASELANDNIVRFSASEESLTSRNADDVLCQSDVNGSDKSRACTVHQPSKEPVSVDSPMKMTRKENVRLPKASDDLSVGTSQYPKPGRRITHRRGASLEFPFDEDTNRQKHGDVLGPDLERHRGDVPGAAAAKLSPPSCSSGRKGSDHARKQSSENSTSNAKNESMSASASMSAKRHNRSRSAYDFNNLIALQEKPTQRRRQGAGGQLARRRNVSLSCDLDKDYRAGGLPPSWREELLSPPMPPQLISEDVSRGTGASGHDESSLRKAFTESLAPWRVEPIAMPVQNERRSSEGRIDPSRKEHKREAFSRGNAGLGSPPLTPSTPKSYVGSPSPSELNKKVDAFIARFHERNRLQRLESLERARRSAR